jgi:hypothetical protein
MLAKPLPGQKEIRREAVASHLTTENHGPVGADSSSLGLGLAKAGDPVPVFPLPAFLEQFRAFKTLEHIAFAAQGGRRAKTTML